MTFARLALALTVVLALAGCSPAADPAAEFGVWASNQNFVVSVESAHLVVDGAIPPDDLTALSASAWEEAAALGLPDGVNLIVGNAWAYSLDADGANATKIATLRDDPLLVGALVEYEPLEPTPGYSGGIRGSVGTQAALRDGYAALAAVAGSADSITAATADGAFSIAGLAQESPETALALWQAIAGRVLPVAAHAEVVNGAESLALTVGSPEDQAVAEAIGATYPEVALIVTH